MTPAAPYACVVAATTDDKPHRVQLSRKKGWRMPPNTVSVARPTRFGNPFTVSGCNEAGFRGTKLELVTRCVGAFRVWLGPYWRNNWDGHESETCRGIVLRELPLLRGKNLACWCPLCDAHKDGKPFGVQCADCSPCHADVLLELANAEPGR